VRSCGFWFTCPSFDWINKLMKSKVIGSEACLLRIWLVFLKCFFFLRKYILKYYFFNFFKINVLKKIKIKKIFKKKLFLIAKKKLTLNILLIIIIYIKMLDCGK